ncbi:Hypothetical protein R9X50_00377700 [Acrodontium crateriforme]|uniref:SWIRM domain-containing protein n=1 Tax=Acrodontium crateriforme TaxID=150365 RepID=A0AAQ3RC59_9PEZI|nr:Hypothetical protein R9X50_00377700 [Acrodontium crateriforme]
MADMTLQQSAASRPIATKLPPQDSYLFTPPEQIHDSFTSVNASCSKETAAQWQVKQNKLAPIQSAVPSPPTTPETRIFDNLPVHNASWPGPDRQLFPDAATRDGPNAQTPLFEPESQQTSPQSVHARLPQTPQPIEPDLDTASRLIEDAGVSDISETRNWGRRIGGNLFIKNSPSGKRGWYMEQMAEINQIRAAQSLPKPVSSAFSPRDPYTIGLLRSVGKPVGITKTKPASKPLIKVATKPKATKAASMTPKAAISAPARRTPKARTVFEFVDSAFPAGGQQTTKHKRAAPTKKVDKGDDRDWRDVPDYSPPISSLKSAPKPLKANWKSSQTPWDISQSPDVEELDPAEHALCETLRLFPVQYLANKRRMFAAKVETLRENSKNFNKTAAQLACNMDVNKASQMWEAFDRVGWFDRRWFEQHL